MKFVRWLTFFSLLTIVSHAADEAATIYGKEKVAKYLLSSENPSRHLFTADGNVVSKSPEDDKLMAESIQHVSDIKMGVNLLRIAQQVFICMLFSFLVSSKRS